MRGMATILLTGASRGIGAATRTALETRGAHVIGQATRAGGDDRNILAADFLDPGAPQHLWEQALERSGGAIDVLSDRAFKLLLLLLERGHREKGVDNRGGTVGPRDCPVSLVRRRFRWSNRTVLSAFEELRTKKYVTVEEEGGLHSGIRRATRYRIGPAHPWVKTEPITHVGNAAVTHVGNDRRSGGRASLPTSETRTDNARTSTTQEQTGESKAQRPDTRSLPTGERDLRSSMYPGFTKAPPECCRIPPDLPDDAVFFHNRSSKTWTARFLGADRRYQWRQLEDI